MAIHPVYRFYAELEDYKPKIWRRFEMNGSKTVAELGYVLMTLFEMEAHHLFCFTDTHLAEHLEDMQKRYSDAALRKLLGIEEYERLMAMKNIRYELSYQNEDDDDETYDAEGFRLRHIFDTPQQELIFEYDYGDGWRVNLTLESCTKVEIHASELPRVLEGEGFGIIEDCGGVADLKEIDNAFKKKKGRRYKECQERLGIDTLDMAAFDVDDINFRLKKLPRIYRECYEYEQAPSQRSIDLIRRKYKKTVGP